jgi:hypothetical protein
MRIPQQVSERVKEAPAQALRAVFSGIGQVLLVADRMRSRAAEPERARSAAPGPATGSNLAASPPVRDETRWRSLDQTGNVRLLPEESEPEPPAAAAPPLTEPGPAATGPATPADAPAPMLVPVPNYDNLTIASLRARLRTLDRSQVVLLLDYEKANAGRPEVLTMFERRIAKLDSNSRDGNGA